MSPLRQYSHILATTGDSKDLAQSKELMEMARKMERKEQYRWADFYDFTPQKIGELLKAPKMGNTLMNFVHKFPRLELSAFF